MAEPSFVDCGPFVDNLVEPTCVSDSFDVMLPLALVLSKPPSGFPLWFAVHSARGHICKDLLSYRIP